MTQTPTQPSEAATRTAASADPEAPSPSDQSSDPSSDRSSDRPNPERAGTGVRTLLDDEGIRRSLVRIAHEIIERTPDPDQLYLVAIPNGGVPLARRLARDLRQIADLDVPVGVLDTTLYRDDLLSTGNRPALRRTEMPSAVDDHIVVLVDDVVKTGRTIRAAMDALMDFGRPRAVQVVGLVDRGHRELPIKLDYVGKNVPTHTGEQVHLREAAGGEGDGGEVRLEMVIFGEPTGGPSDARGEGS